MAKIGFLKIAWDEMKNNFCSIKHLSQKIGVSENYVWNQIKIFDVLGIVEKRHSTENLKLNLYKIKPNIKTFEDFINYFDELKK